MKDNTKIFKQFDATNAYQVNSQTHKCMHATTTDSASPTNVVSNMFPKPYPFHPAGVPVRTRAARRRPPLRCGSPQRQAPAIAETRADRKRPLTQMMMTTTMLMRTMRMRNRQDAGRTVPRAETASHWRGHSPRRRERSDRFCH